MTQVKKEKKVKEKYTKELLIFEVFAALLAAVFVFPILMIINFSFKTKQELYMDPPLSFPGAFRFDNFENAVVKLHLDMEQLSLLMNTP